MSGVREVVADAQRRGPVLQLFALIVLVIYGLVAISGFGESTSIRSMLVLAALLGLSAAGQTFVVILGALDLSVPGLIVFGGIAVTQLCGVDHWSLLPAVFLTVIVCGGFGATVGWLCHRYRIVPLVATIAVSSIALGLTQLWTHSQVSGLAPGSLTKLVAIDATTLGLPISPAVLIWAAFAIAVEVILHRTVFGRQLYATGANLRAADLALVPTRRIWVIVFMVSAILSGLVGVLLAGFEGADTSVGDPYLFQGLAAVIVGGTTFMGARGDYTHTVLGALLLTVLTTVLVGLGLDDADQQMVFGLLILAVVAGYGRRPALRDAV